MLDISSTEEEKVRLNIHNNQQKVHVVTWQWHTHLPPGCAGRLC